MRRIRDEASSSGRRVIRPQATVGADLSASATGAPRHGPGDRPDEQTAGPWSTGSAPWCPAVPECHTVVPSAATTTRSPSDCKIARFAREAVSTAQRTTPEPSLARKLPSGSVDTEAAPARTGCPARKTWVPATTEPVGTGCVMRETGFTVSCGAFPEGACEDPPPGEGGDGTDVLSARRPAGGGARIRRRASRLLGAAHLRAREGDGLARLPGILGRGQEAVRGRRAGRGHPLGLVGDRVEERPRHTLPGGVPEPGRHHRSPDARRIVVAPGSVPTHGSSWEGSVDSIGRRMEKISSRW